MVPISHSRSHFLPVFSLAYQRFVGPTSLQYRVSFDVGIGIIHVLWCGHGLHPNYALLSCREFSLGRTLSSTDGFITEIISNGRDLQSPQELPLQKFIYSVIRQCQWKDRPGHCPPNIYTLKASHHLWVSAKNSPDNTKLPSMVVEPTSATIFSITKFFPLPLNLECNANTIKKISNNCRR